MFHAELFSSSIATGANTFAQVTYFTPDNILPKLVNGVQISPDLPYLLAVMGVGANQVHVRAQSNSMLPFPYISMSPNNRGTAFESPPRIFDFTDWPLPLKPTEELDIFATQNSGAGQTQYVLVLFSNGVLDRPTVRINPPGIADNPTQPGRFFVAHWTAAVTLTAGQWTLVLPVFDQALYAGTYALLGARAFSASGLFFRMFPAMGLKWRPGGVCVQAYDQMDPVNQRYMNAFARQPGGWGQWLTFYQNVPPQVEFFATAADTAEEGWFDLVYLSNTTTQSI